MTDWPDSQDTPCSTSDESTNSAFAWSDERWQRALSVELAALPTGAERLELALCASIDSEPRFHEPRALWNEEIGRAHV